MKKRFLIASLALVLGLPFGLAAGAGPAAAACYVPTSDGGWEEAPNFQDPDSCSMYAGGVWRI